MPVRPSVSPSVRQSVTHELKPCKSAIFNQNYSQYERERILCRVSGLVSQTLTRAFAFLVGCRVFRESFVFVGACLVTACSILIAARVVLIAARVILIAALLNVARIVLAVTLSVAGCVLAARVSWVVAGFDGIVTRVVGTLTVVVVSLATFYVILFILAERILDTFGIY